MRCLQSRAGGETSGKDQKGGCYPFGKISSRVIFLPSASIQLNYVAFNGGGEVNAAILGGHIDMAVSNPGESLELYKAGKIRILGIFAEKRLTGVPDIPTLKEQGVNVVYVQNRGIVAPADIPADASSVPYSETSCGGFRLYSGTTPASIYLCFTSFSRYVFSRSSVTVTALDLSV
jgi:hypothetical protein